MHNTKNMRRVAGVLYLVSFVAELYFMRPILGASALDYAPILFGVLLIFAVGAGAVWMLAGVGYVNRIAARGVAVATALVVLKSLVLYEIENSLLTFSLSELLPSLAQNNLWNYIFIIARLMLLIVAAFFVLNAAEPDAGKAELAADDATTEEIDVNVTVEIDEAGEVTEVDVEETISNADTAGDDDEDGKASEQETEKDKDRLRELEEGMEKTLPGNDR